MERFLHGKTRSQRQLHLSGLFRRTPSLARQEASGTTPVLKTPRRAQRMEAGKEPADELSKSPSRSTRSRKTSTNSDEPSSSVSKSPTRRSSSRAASQIKVLDVEQPEVKPKRGSSRARRALNERFTAPVLFSTQNDARAYFDKVTEEKMAELRSSRRRTLSDSIVPEVKTKRYRQKVAVEDTIAEAEDETGSVVSSSSGTVTTRSRDNAEKLVATPRTPSLRQRRASSATPVETATPSKRTRKASDSIPEPSTPRSPGRRGRPRKIEPIPE